MYKILSRELMEEAYKLLNKEQKIFLENYVKRGKKTQWLNSWAKKLGAALTEEELDDPEASMNKLLKWVLLEYEEAEARTGEMRCECGRALKYRYTIKNLETGKLYRLGIIHLQQHTGLNPELVREISKGLRKIDLEKDEILSKVLENRELSFNVPEGLELPRDIKLQLNIGLPLLDSQEKRLKKLINDINGRVDIKRNIDLVQLPKDNSILDVDKAYEYIGKLEKLEISEEEILQLYKFIKDNISTLEKYNIDIRTIKRYVIKAEANMKNRNVRKCLIDMEYIIDYYC
ncbi:hypothetical protein [Clostridium sp. C8-1-8]|uniref:hypothetical protein n=1 Tax=Clostridium sp. C8-1-8 TaxID=2698831 RepID=UPI00136D9D76|nr:hypothetical protein [Clostridium sp. C8-1-8]